jgi:kynurenine formamidase
METFEYRNKRVTLIDLSDLLQNATSDFEPAAHHITYLSATDGLAMSEKWVGLGAEYWPQGQAWVAERVDLATHSGTHIDAPAHYGPTASGAPPRTIEHVPLRWCFGDGVVLNMTHKERGAAITVEDIENELQRIGYALKPYDIVLIRTDVSQHFKERGYEFLHPGLTRASTEYLVDRGVKLIGIDAWGLDRPLDVMAEEARAGKSQFWEAHLLGREKEYLQIEKLSNLAELPKPFGFTVMAFPAKIENASAGWSRVVALFEEPLP